MGRYFRFDDMPAPDEKPPQGDPPTPDEKPPQGDPPTPDDTTPGASGQNVPKPKPGGKLRQEGKTAKPSDKLRHEGDTPGGDSGKPGIQSVRDGKALNKSKLHMEKSGDKLDAAYKKIAAQKPSKKPGLAKTAGRGAKSETLAYVHRKIYQVEEDNAGVKAAHRVELAGEGVARAGIRFAKHRSRTRPARRARKWEKRDMKAKADFNYRVMTQDNPELMKKAASRRMQKKRLKKQYQKQAREAAKKAANKTGKAALSVAEKAGRVAVGVVRFAARHPIGTIIALLCILLVIILQSCVSMATTLGGGMGGAVGASTYPSEDSEMLAAEAAYAGLEADLQYKLNNYETLNPGYHEYHYDIDGISHDPYVLISILTALRDGAWTFDEVSGALQTLFDMQYTLTETVAVEVRYYTEYWSYTDPDTGETVSGSYEVPYNYYICTVTLDNFNMSHLPIYIMGEDALGRYALFMSTLGNRPDLFPGHLYPHASTYQEYGRHDIPPEYLEADPVFAAVIAEGEKYLGYPYVWSGYCPQTSFDCSGFVSWVYNHSGWNFGRLTAQGLYNICTPVSAANVKPGDLVFFIGTYETPEISHVGIYVGDGFMLHCGSPIGYISIEGSYYQSHLYAYGKLY